MPRMRIFNRISIADYSRTPTTLAALAVLLLVCSQAALAAAAAHHSRLHRRSLLQAGEGGDPPTPGPKFEEFGLLKEPDFGTTIEGNGQLGDRLQRLVGALNALAERELIRLTLTAGCWCCQH